MFTRKDIVLCKDRGDRLEQEYISDINSTSKNWK